MPQSKKKRPAAKSDQAQKTEATIEQYSTEDVDDLLDEIDEVLETNAEEFVKAYVQKGGE